MEQIEKLRGLASQLDLRPGPGGSRITHLLAKSSEVEEIVGLKGKAMVVRLNNSCQLVGHTDAPIKGKRVHVPLVVNEGCWVFHAGSWQQLEVGKMYEMDPTEEHGAVNWGTDPRFHLIVDIENG